MIKLNNINFKYKGNTALKDINLEIHKGETVALIGTNGSGKSTLLKLLNGIVFPCSGTYFFNDDEITAKAMESNRFSKLFHKRIGFVFQNSDAQLFCTNVYEEIAFGPRQMELEEKEVHQRVMDCLSLLNIEELKHRAPYNLSEGEKKRVAIASVLAMNPEVLVLDEPMNGLDPRTKRFLKDILKRLNEAGKTIICSTHDFEYAEGIFKRAVVFSKEHTIIKDDDYKKIISDDNFLEINNIK